MHSPSLATTFLLLALQMAASTSAAPVPASMNCGGSAISFLSPRYQSILGIRQYCSTIRRRGGEFTLFISSTTPLEESFEEEGELHSKRDMLPTPPSVEPVVRFEYQPVAEYTTQASTVDPADLQLEADLAALRASLRKHIAPARVPTSSPSASLSLKATKTQLAELGKYTWQDFHRRTHALFIALSSIDDNLAVAGAIAVVCVVFVLLAVELLVGRKKLLAQQRRRMLMKRMTRRAAKIRVTR